MADYLQIRSFLAGNVENLLEHISIRRQSKRILADDLFGQEEDGSKMNWQKPSQSVSKIDILLAEKESLGLYVSGNPLEDYVPIWQWVREVTGRDDIFIILIDKVKKIFTKSNNMMFAMEISMPDLEAEAIIFPKNSLKLSPLLEEKEIYWVKGKIQQPKKNKSKEVPDKEARDMSVESEGEQIKEFDALPKLIIDEMVLFTSGILSLLDSEEIPLSINRQEPLKKLDWQWLKSNPLKFTQQSDDSDKQVLQTNTTSAVFKPVVGKLFLPKTLGADRLNNIKANLHPYPEPGYVEVTIEVETSSGIKTVKGTHWVESSIYQQFKK